MIYQRKGDYMRGQTDTYKETKVFTYPNATVKVHLPDLTEEERNRRFKIIHNAAAELLKTKQFEQ